MNILVTGGAGFIGSNFARGLIQTLTSESKLQVLDSLTYAGNLANLDSIKNDSRFEFVQGDIRDHALVSKLLQDVEIVVHFAAESHVDRSIENPDEFISTNVLGTNTLLNASLNSNIRKFIHVSTDEVYGSIDKGSWTELSPIAPNSPYAASKASSDLVALAYFKTFGLPVTITRCSNNYGPFQYPEKLIPLAITNLMSETPIPIYGDGSNSRDWLDVRDHCRAINLVIENGKAGEIYNIGGGQELNNLELAKYLVSAFGLGDEYIEFVEDRKGHDQRYSVSYEKIHRECGYSPMYNFRDSLDETIEWYQKNEVWWRPLKSSLNK
jgi:dTDP-glucose 4,6-dehydratase